MGVFLKSPVQLRKIPAEFWGLIGRMKVDYLRQSGEPTTPVTQEEEQLERLTKLKGKNKLTKKKHRELLELSKKIKKRRETEKGEETNRRLRKEVQKELAESNAVGDTRSQNNLKRQIILKVFYIVLRVIRSYVNEDAFDVILDVLFVFMPKADPEFCSEVLRELQAAYTSIDEEDQAREGNAGRKGGPSAERFMAKKMLILNAITKLSNENRWLNRAQFGCGKHVHDHLLLQLRGGIPEVAVGTDGSSNLPHGDPVRPDRKSLVQKEGF